MIYELHYYFNSNSFINLFVHTSYCDVEEEAVKVKVECILDQSLIKILIHSLNIEAASLDGIKSILPQCIAPPCNQS